MWVTSHMYCLLGVRIGDNYLLKHLIKKNDDKLLVTGFET